MTTSKSSSLSEALGQFLGLAITVFVVGCLRAWVLSLCSAIFFPNFVLGFWQWWLIAYTFRLMLAPNHSND